MFFVYLWREIRRRLRQAIFISLGLALGVGLVITVTAASAGVRDAQSTVLHSLYGVGTDVTVTQPAAKGSGTPVGFQVRQEIKSSFGGSKPSSGTKFSKNLLVSSASGLGTLSSSSVPRVARLPGVSAAAAGLALTDLEVSGTIPSAASRSARLDTSINTNSFSILGADVSAGRAGPLSSEKLTSGRTFTGADRNASVALVDANYAAQHKLKPGSTVGIGTGGGSSTTFKVIGVVQSAPGATPADVYIPLARAQASAGLKGKVNTIYVTAGSASGIGAVQQKIRGLLPSATVTTSGDLASQVSGSLASTATLASNLGVWLEAAVLVSAFLLASLLTMAAVSRRVREFGTLKALGWRSRRVVAQVLGETITMGIAGGLAGTALGIGGATLVSRLAPAMTASVGQALGSAAPGSGAAGSVVQSLNASTVHTVSVSLTAPVTAGAALSAVLLAIAGGLIAGGLGGWRAALLRPAAALARVE
jgi:ABC-type antimicrobial peptide transport system permease subunit